ncbi:MAG: DUF4335 domain-containing protein, partial [Cyanobacteriota bacterium]|nr:DUF4335 domain-containing protein [Cyanobacteriota bacterium]
MLFSTPAIRRYTPPTCTLKIMGKTSPLSRWGSRLLFKKLRFELNFDDPRKLVEEQVALAGDRAQLDRLCEVVSNYVQEFLMNSSPERLSAGFAFPLLEEAASESPVGFEPQKETAGVFPVESQSPSPPPFPAESPSLKPKGLLRHFLFFGDLATPASGEGIDLSATQLFDLAMALEEYSSEIDVLPDLGGALAPRTPALYWTRIAASAVLAVGLATAAIQWQNSDRTTPSTAASDEEELTASNSPAVEPLPLPSPPANLPSPSPVAPSPLSSLNPLKPPSAVSPPSPQDSTRTTPAPSSPAPAITIPSGQSGNASSEPPRSQGKRSPSSSPAQKPPPVPPPAPQITATRGSTAPPPPSSPPPLPREPQPVPSIPPLPSLDSELQSPTLGERASIDTQLSEAAKQPASEVREPESGALRGASPASQVRNYFQQQWQ